MAITLGKRKRVGETTKVASKPAPKPAKVEEKESENDDDDNDDDLRAIFQRAFEARFKPIDGAASKKKKEKVEQEEEDEEELEEDGAEGDDSDEEEEDEDDDESDESGFDGLSDDENEVEVIEHTDIKRRGEILDKKQLKAFMSAKPPSFDSQILQTGAKGKQQNNKTEGEDDGTDASNLKNDLALQRLLNESHLLDSSFTSTDPSGKNRHKATDLRLLSLGSKASILEQKNMPLSHRKGINAKKQTKEIDRRREAKENGIILERATSKNKSSSGSVGPAEKRARGIGAPSVGRFTGGTLRLSKQDIAGITGPRTSPAKRGGGRGGSRGGRGKRGKR